MDAEFDAGADRASTRDVFAAGAIRASKWINGKAAGYYEMTDILGL